MEAKLSPCPVCNGTGKTVVNVHGKQGIHTQLCAVCSGTGQLHEKIASHMAKSFENLANWVKAQVATKGTPDMSIPAGNNPNWKFDPETGLALPNPGDLVEKAIENPGIASAMAEVAKQAGAAVVQGAKQKLAMECADVTLQFAKKHLAEKYPMIGMLGPLGDMALIGLVSVGLKTGLKSHGDLIPNMFQPKILEAFANLSMQGAMHQFGKEGVEVLMPMVKEFGALATGKLSGALSAGEMKKLTEPEEEGQEDVA